MHAIRKKKSTTISKKLSYNEHKLKIHVSTLLLQSTSTPLFRKEILCIWFLLWNYCLTKHKNSIKIAHTHTNTQQIQVCNKNELLSKYGCCPVTVATKSSRNQTTFAILDSNLIIWAHPKKKKKKKSFYEMLKKTMGFCWFLDLQGNVIMKYLRKIFFEEK